MGYPTDAEAEVYKARTIQSQVRVAVELDYPVFADDGYGLGTFFDDFDGSEVDADQWFQWCPSWGTVTVAGSTVTLGVSENGIAPPWLQSRHNLAFPLRRDTDWHFATRLRFPYMTGYGVFMRICGRSMRDAEAIWAVKADTANGITCHCPDGFTADNIVWSTAGAGTDWRNFAVWYDASAQAYTVGIDQNNDVVDMEDQADPGWDVLTVVPVAGRYADSIVIGNSTAIQGTLGDWTQIEVAYVGVSGTAESVEDPEWAAPFTHDGTRFSYLPTVKSGRLHVDKDNLVDAAEVELDNFWLDAEGGQFPQAYMHMRFLNRRALIEARAGDGNGKWTSWQVLFDGLCTEKQVTLREGGQCVLSLPMRDRRRAVADDMEVMGCYSDLDEEIPGVGMNMTVAQIIEDVYQQKCGLPAAAMNVVATPDNTPRNYNVFRQSAQQAVKTLAEHAALAVWQRISDARIEVQEWAWGDDTPGYSLSTAEEIKLLEWTESAFDVTSAEQLAFENTNLTNGGFTTIWPPHREPYYGRQVHSNAVVCQSSDDHDARPVAALAWWARNRKLGSVFITAPAQLWVEHDLEIRVRDDRLLGLDDTYIVDGWEHTWDDRGQIATRIRAINPHPDEFLRQNLMP